MSPSVPSKVGLILLAAGGSRRMGTPKQLLTIDGEPMVRRAALEGLSSDCEPLVVVLGSEFAAIVPALRDLPLRVVRNSAWETGMGSSIRAGIAVLARYPVTATIVALADQPGVDAATYRQLVTTYRNCGQPVIATEYAGTWGAPALFDRAIFGELADIPDEVGCKPLIYKNPERVASIPNPSAAFDIDTPEDYRRWLGGIPST